jgi:MFS family permease
LLGRFTTSATLIALVLAAEGLFAISLPLVIGPWSDTSHTPLGRRRPFMLVALGPISFCLALMAFMPSLWTTALLVFAFFFAYYVYEPPYRGLYPDLLPERIYGRAQSAAPDARRLPRRGADRRRRALSGLGGVPVPRGGVRRRRRLRRARSATRTCAAS